MVIWLSVVFFPTTEKERARGGRETPAKQYVGDTAELIYMVHIFSYVLKISGAQHSVTILYYRTTISSFWRSLVKRDEVVVW